MSLDGTTCIITGGARGIGFALADRFLAEGAAGVTVVDLDPADCAAAAARLIERHGDRVLDHAADVSREDEVRAAVGRTEERFGPVGLFAANAGIGTGMGLDADDSAWERTWQVNVMAHVVAARVVVPGMVERGGGTFLTTASAAGLLAQIGDAPYSVTKHAAVAFAEWLAITYTDHGLQVACLCPQGVNTDLLRGGMGSSAAVETVTMQGVIEPEQVAEAVVAGLDERRFLILPHPEVAEYQRRRATDPDRWLAGMRRLQALVIGGHAGG
ncbi:SDR family oxidoreductase [Iamia sp.]|uniref:SDR family NAD(P)-dependent oxidoreductase n=1 Tax=Iamia sp. TaxID=2722710 RepID=UPI002BE990E6|nr:SDR family oxidoreductase [Iamia sp.]HXH55994.1 SDR family oxidoreductase [Iamia sp.]